MGRGVLAAGWQGRRVRWHPIVPPSTAAWSQPCTAAGVPVPVGGRDGKHPCLSRGVGCHCHGGVCAAAEGLCSPSSKRSLGSGPFPAVMAQGGQILRNAWNNKFTFRRKRGSEKSLATLSGVTHCRPGKAAPTSFLLGPI